ncbi:hypothetical protein [Mesobacillus stamsii]|uniref:AP2 domain-containing protein n=1 Tax=Mesobacillus stamsii TaxID=225347 RepID=A0ABU0FXA4_9BACI|nr:hypothetical protein [Mesobacillus stamsii]MDQ0414571.1 hypothetical protein [Mesobacillus stamsii]
MGKKIDITRERYGSLVAIKEVTQIGTKRRYLCQCDCGNTITARMESLRSGNTKSCGCIKPENVSKANLNDLTGKRFGKLTVIKRSQEKQNAGHSFWECVCDCGNTTVVDGSNLVSGNTKSCGCIWRKNNK